MEGRIITPEELAKAERFGEVVPVYKVDATTVVKTGEIVRLAEAEAMKLVREKTTIPIPKIYNVYTDAVSGHVSIVMEYVEGDRLADVWDKFSSDQKNEVIEQLRDVFSQLRKIKGSFIGSVDGTPCEDQLFSDEIGAYGPYEDEASFNKGITTALQRTLTGGWANTVSDMVVNVLKNHEIVMTHGDFNPRNIIVKGTKVAALLDWEMAGFYPEYWEYVKALYQPAWEESWIKERNVDKILEPYFPELAVILHARTIVW